MGASERDLEQYAMQEQLFGVVVGLAIGLILIAIMVFIFRWLWNTTLPEVFGIKQISFGQAIKILILAGILFGGHRVVEVPQQVSDEVDSGVEQAQ